MGFKTFTLLALSGIMLSLPVSAQRHSRGHVPIRKQIHEVVTSLTNSKKVKKAPASTIPITPNWSTDFTTQTDYDLFTTIDANNDATPMSSGSTLMKEAWNYSYNMLYFYSDKNKADDYLVSPAFNLKAGHSYKVKYTISCFRPHKAEIKFGMSATVGELLYTALPEQEFKTNTTLEATIVPATNGAYYVAIHCLSEPSGYNMYLKGFSIESMASPKVPNAVQDVSVVPDASAALQATIQFKAPTQAQDNSELTELSGVRITSNNKEVANITDVAPGKTVEFTDPQIDSIGIKEYTIVPYNSLGDGVPSTVSQWIGLDIPSAPSNRILSADVDKLTLVWDASSATNGGVIFQDKINYNIFDVASSSGSYYVSNKLGTVTGKTSFSVNMPTEEGEQHYHYLGIEATNDAGSSGHYISTPVLIGESYQLPMRENFASGTVEHWWGRSQVGNGNLYKPVAEASLTTDTDGDGDGVSLYLRTVMNDSVSFYSGKIVLVGTVDPTLSFKMKSEAYRGTFYPFVLFPDGTKENLDAIAVGLDADWKVMSYSLDKYKSQRWIEIGFALCDPLGENEQLVRVDNIHVAQKANTDVAVTVEATPQLTKGEEATVNVKVDNYGAAVLNGYHLLVTVGGEIVADRDITEATAPLGYQKFTFPYSTTPLDDRESLDVHVAVSTTNDADESNNQAEAVIKQDNPDLMKASDLKAEASDGKTSITWMAPPAVRQVTENFDSYTAWSADVAGNWAFVDGDKAETSGLVDQYRFFYQNEGTPFAFIIFNSSLYGEKGAEVDITKLYPCTNPKSGSQSLSAFYGYALDMSIYDYALADADNWAISPELPGQAQTIQLSANNFYESGTYEGQPYEFDYPETFDVLYSTSGTAVNDFQKIGDTHTLTGGKWQDFTVDLPAGAKYFAIHHNSKAQEDAQGYVISPYLFSIDDVVFTVANKKVLHYNVYRDGKLIASPVAPSFMDTADGSEHVYQITVVYEGDLESNPISSSASTGILSVSNTQADNAVKAIYTLDGKQVRVMKNGVYIVRYQDGTVKKVAVR